MLSATEQSRMGPVSQFTPTDIQFLQKLNNIIFNASLHCQDESKTYAILNTIFTPYMELFSSNNPGVSVFTTPQDKLVGPKKMRASPNGELAHVIPDMTVKVTRRQKDGGENGNRWFILVIKAKRLCIATPASTYITTPSIMLSNMSTAPDLHPWPDIEAGRKAATGAFRQNLAQLIL